MNPSSYDGRFLFAGALIGGAWLFPGEPIGALLNFVGFLLYFLGAERARHPYRSSYLCGCLAVTLGFHWLIGTINRFGGFPLPATLAIFGLFVFGTAVPFVSAVLLYRHMPGMLRTPGIRGALAWIAAETCSVRIFPWSAAHPLSAFPILTQLAEFGGVTLLTALLIAICDLCALAISTKRVRPLITALLIIAIWVPIGAIRSLTDFSAEAAPVEVAAVQANIPIIMKHDRDRIFANIAAHRMASDPLRAPNRIIIWPETAVMSWLADNMQTLPAGDPRFPSPPLGNGYLFGALTYQRGSPGNERLYNSVMALNADGSFSPAYHKRILMPFGEYTPFSEQFPWLKDLNKMVGEFSVGEGSPLVSLKIEDGAGQDRTVKAAPLICYEDVLPTPSRNAVREGAEILVNVTNDGWFGDTVAPLQHHQIALFRAIETRRFLIRATNSGFTAVVSPWGKTVDSLPPFSDGTLLAGAALIQYKSFYSAVNVPMFWVGIGTLGALAALGSLLLSTARKPERF